jgi:hypothetical protein
LVLTLISMADDRVVFRWRDDRHGKTKFMTLDAHEIIRRFLLHTLPDGFHRVRQYAFLANSRVPQAAGCHTAGTRSSIGCSKADASPSCPMFPAAADREAGESFK